MRMKWGLRKMKHYLTKSDYLICAILSYLEMFLYGYAFYWHIPIALLIGCMGVVKLKQRLKALVNRRKEKTLGDFSEFLDGVNIMLMAGKSIENSFECVYAEMIENQVKDGVFLRGIRELITGIHGGLNSEEVLKELSVTLDIGLVYDFVKGFEVSYRKGGDINKLINMTSSIIGDKLDTSVEIDALLSGKRYEIGVMKVMPLIMIFTLNKMVPEYMMPNYNTALGRLIMTCSGLFILGSNILVDRIGRVML